MKVVLAEVLGFHLGQLVEQLVGQVRGVGAAQQLERVQGGEKAGKFLKLLKKGVLKLRMYLSPVGGAVMVCSSPEAMISTSWGSRVRSWPAMFVW